MSLPTHVGFLDVKHISTSVKECLYMPFCRWFPLPPAKTGKGETPKIDPSKKLFQMTRNCFLVSFEKDLNDTKRFQMTLNQI